MLRELKIGDVVYNVSSDDQYLAAMGQEFEPNMVQLFRALVSSDDVVADIGANIGLTAMLFSELAEKTFAFEPSASTYKILLENLTRNQIANVHSFNLGLGKKHERLTITFGSNNRSGGYVSEKIRPELGYTNEEIEIETIDRFFVAQKITPSFIKIDVEGFEMNVIEGARRFLALHRPTVVMEMNHFCLDVLQRITVPDFLDCMRSAFPFLYAVDADNRTVANLHKADEAYGVMHEHVVKGRYPNIVGSFGENIKSKLNTLLDAANGSITISNVSSSSIPTLLGSIETIGSISRITAKGEFEIRVVISNKGPSKWDTGGEHPIFLSYHWKNLNGDMCVFDGLRSTILYPEVDHQTTFEQSMTIVAPSRSGTYLLVLSLVQEGVCWFEDRGFNCSEIQVEVV